MDEQQMREVFIDIATMKNDIGFLKDIFRESKEETKEFHDKQTKQFDEMAKRWNEVGGSLKLMADISTRLTNNEKEIAKLKAWRTAIIGGAAAILFLVNQNIIKIRNLF